MVEKKTTQKTDGIDTIDKQLARLLQNKDPHDSSLYKICSNIADVFDFPLEQLAASLDLYKMGEKKLARLFITNPEFQKSLSLDIVDSREIENAHPEGKELVNGINTALDKLKHQTKQILQWMEEDISWNVLDILVLPTPNVKEEPQQYLQRSLQSLPKSIQDVVAEELKNKTPLDHNPFKQQPNFRNLLVSKCLVSADAEKVAESLTRYVYGMILPPEKLEKMIEKVKRKENE